MSACQTARMRTTVVWLSVLVAGTLAAGCAGESAPDATLTPIVSTTTTTTTVPATTTPAVTAPATTTPAATTTSSTSTTSTTSTTTTTSTTIPAAAELDLDDAGLGEALFGTDPTEVVAYVTSILGKPTADSGWADPVTLFGVCPGNEARTVTWGDLTMLFSDDTPVQPGRRHFFSYVIGPPLGSSVQPAGMRTPEGIGVGSTVGELRFTYPNVELYQDDTSAAAEFSVPEGVTGFLSGTADTDLVRAIVGGTACAD